MNTVMLVSHAWLIPLAELPITGAVGLLLLGAFVATAARWSGWEPGPRVGMAMGVLGGAALAATLLLQSPREKAMGLTAELVAASESLEGSGPDRLAMERLIAPSLELADRDGRVVSSGPAFRDRLLEGIERMGVDHLRTAGLSGTAEGPGRVSCEVDLRTMLSVRAEGLGAGITGGPYATRWRLQWQDLPGVGWRVTRLVWLSLQDEPPPTDDLRSWP